MMHFKLLEKQGQTKPKKSTWKEIKKISAEISEIKTKYIYTKTQLNKKLVLWKD
jgi:hypothetical protein